MNNLFANQPALAAGPFGVGRIPTGAFDIQHREPSGGRGAYRSACQHQGNQCRPSATFELTSCGCGCIFCSHKTFRPALTCDRYAVVGHSDLHSTKPPQSHKISSRRQNHTPQLPLPLQSASVQAKAADVNQKLVAADETKKSINEKREQFRPVATRGSVLYFSVVELSLVNVMYQTSLDQFLEIFMGSMDRAEKASLASKRWPCVPLLLLLHIAVAWVLLVFVGASEDMDSDGKEVVI